MALKVGELYAALGLDDKNFEKGMKNSKSKFNKTSKDLMKTAGKAAVGTSAAIAGIGAAAFAMTEKVTSSFDDIAKGAQRLGVSTKAYQEMDFWASQNGISHQNMEKIVGRFNQRLGQAVNGNDKYADALSDVGLNLEKVRDGSLSTEDAYAQTIQKLSEMDSEQDKVNAATEIFGQRTARDLLPALQEGALSMDDAKKKAEELGIVIGDDALEAGVEFQDTWDQLKRTMTTVSQSMMAEVIPVFQTMMDWVLDNMPTIKDVFSTIFGVIREILGTVITKIQEFINWLQTLFDRNEETLSMLWQSYQNYLSFIIEYWTEVFSSIKTVVEEALNFLVPFIQELLTQIYEFWQENGQQILENAILVFNGIKETVQTALEMAWEIIQSILEQVVPFIQENLRKIQDFWNENGQQIMEAVDNAFSFIQTIIKTIMPAVKFIIEMAWTAIEHIISGALDVIMGLIKTFAGIFTGDMSKLWEGIKQLFSGALEAIWGFFNFTLVGKTVKLIKSFATLGKSLFTGFKNTAISIFNSFRSRIQNIISNLLSRVRSIFSNIKNAMVNRIRDGVNLVKDAVRGMLDFIKGIGSSFLSAGKGLIDQMVKGIRNAAGRAKDAVKDIAGSVRNLLPFSPAKEGPLSDLDKLDFGGPISDSLKKASSGVKRQMAQLLDLPQPNMELPGVGAPDMNATSTGSSGDNNSDQSKPAILQLMLGGQEFEAHVDDITKSQDKKAYKLRKKKG